MPQKAPIKRKSETNAEDRKKLLTQLGHHSRFVKMMGWTLGAVGLYFAIGTAWQLKNSLLFDLVGKLIFGTSRSPGIPVAIVQSILPTFMAPYAVYFAVGIPLALWGYQIGFEYFNKHFFEPKAPGKPNDASKNEKETPVLDNALEKTPSSTKKLTVDATSSATKGKKPTKLVPATAKQAVTKPVTAAKQVPTKLTPLFKLQQSRSNAKLAEAKKKATEAKKVAPAKQRTVRHK